MHDLCDIFFCVCRDWWKVRRFAKKKFPETHWQSDSVFRRKNWSMGYHLHVPFFPVCVFCTPHVVRSRCVERSPRVCTARGVFWATGQSPVATVVFSDVVDCWAIDVWPAVVGWAWVAIAWVTIVSNNVMTRSRACVRCCSCCDSGCCVVLLSLARLIVMSVTMHPVMNASVMQQVMCNRFICDSSWRLCMVSVWWFDQVIVPGSEQIWWLFPCCPRWWWVWCVVILCTWCGCVVGCSVEQLIICRPHHDPDDVIRILESLQWRIVCNIWWIVSCCCDFWSCRPCSSSPQPLCRNVLHWLVAGHWCDAGSLVLWTCQATLDRSLVLCHLEGTCICDDSIQLLRVLGCLVRFYNSYVCVLLSD